MHRTQDYRDVAVESVLGPDVLLLRAMDGLEQLSRPFEFKLELLSEAEPFELDDVVGTNMTVRCETVDGDTRYFNGYVSCFVMAGYRDEQYRYRATLVPWLWFLTRTADCRIYQEMSVPDIIEQVFTDLGFDKYDLRLNGTHPPLDYCVQYRETAFAFVSRLMEREGIYYFFEHLNGEHTLVLADGPASHEPIVGDEGIPFSHPGDASEIFRYISSWEVAKEVQTGTVALGSFDFTAPDRSLAVRSEESRGHEAAGMTVFDYVAKYTEDDEGTRYAGIRLNQAQSRYEVGYGASNAGGICPGGKFVLVGHPRSDQDREYLICKAEYRVRSDSFGSAGVDEAGHDDGAHFGVFSSTFEAIPAGQTFRAPAITPRPMIRGPQTAIVVGQAGEEIDTDKHGRVKVHFHWDRYGMADESGSCWIRVSQSWAGKGWGAIYLPRIGQEVIVEFLEGDPDRPIITGRVYNGNAMPPYGLPDNKTISTLKSGSSKGGGGFNEIRFEDEKGEEQIFIHGEKNMDIRVKADRYEFEGGERHLIVKKKKLEKVEKSRHEIVTEGHFEQIGGDRHVEVNGQEAKKVGMALTLDVAGDVVEKFGANQKSEITQTLAIKALAVKIEASTGIELKCGGSSICITPAAIFIVGGPLVNINTGAGPPVAPVVALAASPTAPTDPEEADVADPGEVSEAKAKQAQAGTGKYGSIKAREKMTLESTVAEEAQQKTWFEFQVFGADGKPLANENVEVKLKDGQTIKESTSKKGVVRIEDVVRSDIASAGLADRKNEDYEPLSTGPEQDEVPPVSL